MFKILTELTGMIMIFVIGYIALLWGVAAGFY